LHSFLTIIASHLTPGFKIYSMICVSRVILYTPGSVDDGKQRGGLLQIKPCAFP